MQDQEKESLLFSIRRSIRYHLRRRRFLDQCHRMMMLFYILGGSATIVSLLTRAGDVYIGLFAFFITLSSAIELTFNPTELARLYEKLARRFFEIEKKIVEKEAISKEELLSFKCLRLDIEKDEPPPLKILDTICHNELLRATGYNEKDFVEIKWYQRLFCQLFDIREHLINSNTHSSDKQ